MDGIKQQSSATMLCNFARCERFLSSVYQWENNTMIRIFSMVCLIRFLHGIICAGLRLK